MQELPAQDIIRTLERSVKDFAGEAEQNDDLTMLALRLKHDPDSQEMELVLENRLTEILRLETSSSRRGNVPVSCR